MINKKPTSHKVGKKTRSLFGSLSFRVLSVSLVFIVVPLIFYSIVIFTKDYRQRIRNVYTELSLSQQDQANYLTQLENDNLNFATTFFELLEILKKKGEIDEDEISRTLYEFVKKGSVTAFFYLEIGADGSLMCKNSTFRPYEGVDFSKFFTIGELNLHQPNIFIAKDPFFQHSMFITYEVRDLQGKLVGISVTSVSLDLIVKKLMSLRTPFDMEISILDKENNVIASSESDLLGEKFVFEKRDDDVPPHFDSEKHEILLQQDSTVDNGFSFRSVGKKHFGVITNLPKTEAKLFLSTPSKIVVYRIIDSIWRLVIFLVFILVIGGAAAFILTLRISKPLRQIRRVMGKVGQGDLTQRFQHDPMGFEINLLGEQFNGMVTSLIQYIEEVKQERAIKEAYAKELQIGRKIQASILPEKTVDLPEIDTAVYFSPAKEVAGDYYDWIVLDDKVIYVIADGVGKGISGCLYAFDLRSILRSFTTIEKDLKNAVILTNRLFCVDTKESGNFVTAFVATFDRKTKTLTSVNCGHNYPIIKYAKGGLKRLDLKGTAFGVEEYTNVMVGEDQLNRGDFIVFYTDGISEAQNKAGELFSEKRLEGVIENSKANRPQELIDEIHTAIDEFVAGASQYDDMTLIVVKVLG